MCEGKKQAIPFLVLLSTVLAAVVLPQRLILSREPPTSGTLPPMSHQELSLPPTATAWYLPDYPAIEAMRENVVHTFRLCETEFQGPGGPVRGLVPAQEYGIIFVRDTSTMIPTLQYFYGDDYLRTPIEEFLRRQYGADTQSADGDIPGDGAISAVIAPDGHIDKATAVSDEETHLIHAAHQYYRIAGGIDWLQKELEGETIMSRLNRALEWLYTRRFDSTHQLIKRGHTTDWGDVRFEPSVSATDLDADTDHWTYSSYDQALTYRALLELAEMNQMLEDRVRASDLQRRAERLRCSTNEKLWNPQGGFYLVHKHLTPLAHDFPEEEMIGISNALAANVGLSDLHRSQRVFSNLESARLAAGSRKPGLSLYPPYPEGFFAHVQMSPGEYQNGGQWDWWGGMQITAEFESGHSALALAHLRMVAQDWALHPGQVFEWQMPSTAEGWGSDNYASAAATVAKAVVRGLFGVTVERDQASVQPRLRKHDGQIRALQPASGLYVSYDYKYHRDFIVLDYGSSHPRALEVSLLLPLGKETEKVSIDGAPISHRMETILQDSYCVFRAPSGVHRAVVSFKSR
ncbi:MAG: hypothetical protein CEE40_02130 [Chloroflexi bacterium B3_Chlor]|nr:MAG: hypothetical protein CEE40_02130 [Chloroflexi bacterium B3_Chlor]